MENIVVLTGAGISAESGLSTFRDSGGLWEQYNVYEVATPEAWEKDQALVLDFYNQRRKQVLEAEPNAAHYALARLEEKFNVTIITQNVDNLHERAGSTNIIHLHGEITKAQSSVDPSLVYDIDDWELESGRTCEKGSQLRPHIVWFGEAVPKMTDATIITEGAGKLIVIGTSLNVYPAAGLIDVAGKEIDKYLIDPGEMNVGGVDNLTIIQEKASTGVPKLAEELLANA